jgi:geranylgeranylglycerol-phosphate geranylgeranyltransferase
MNPYLELMRVGNCLMASIAVAIGYFLTTLNPTINLLIVMLAGFLVCAGGQAINDVFDSEIDKKINKKKAIPSKRITKEKALYFSIILFIIGVLLAALVNTQVLLIALILSFLLIIYSSVLYKTKYLGNIIVALGTAITFVFGAAVNQITLLVIILAITAFFANMAREVTKDFEDLKKDKGFKKTLPMIHKKWAKRLIVFYYFLSICFGVSAFVVFNLNLGYLFFVYLTTFVFFIGIYGLHNNDFTKSKKNSKKGMLFSLIAFISAIFK